MVSGIQHHSNLVTRLVGDHRQLLESFGVLKKSAEASDAVAFKQALQGFMALLIPHLLEEAVRLYSCRRGFVRYTFAHWATFSRQLCHWIPRECVHCRSIAGYFSAADAAPVPSQSWRLTQRQLLRSDPAAKAAS